MQLQLGSPIPLTCHHPPSRRLERGVIQAFGTPSILVLLIISLQTRSQTFRNLTPHNKHSRIANVAHTIIIGTSHTRQTVALNYIDEPYNDREHKAVNIVKCVYRYRTYLNVSNKMVHETCDKLVFIISYNINSKPNFTLAIGCYNNFWPS